MEGNAPDRDSEPDYYLLMASGNPDLKKAENTRLALEKFGKYLVAESRKNLTRKKKNVTNTLYNSLDYEITTGPNSLEFDFLMAEYGEWVDKGRKKGKMPPFGPIYAWAARRRLQFKDGKGKFLSYADTARLVMIKIKAKGIEPSDFYTRPFNLGFAKLPNEIVEAYGIDVENFIEFTIKKLNLKYK
jgi:hypothetical protein